MTRPLFTVVIPTYNRSHTIARALRSCAQQTCQDFEVVVVDDERSSDDIRGAIAGFDDLRIRLIAGHPGRAAAARNMGARVAEGKFVAFLDSDDEFLPHKLDICRQALTNKQNHLIYSQTYVDRGVSRLWVKPARGLLEGENIFDYLFIHKGWVHPSTVVVDVDLARRWPFREDLSFGDDTQFAADLWLHGVPLTMIEQPLAIYEDLSVATRLSQSPIFAPADSPEHASFIQWVESHRTEMSARAYRAYQAFFLSRFMARVAPSTAFRYIWCAYRNGLGGRQCLAQAVQTFAPGLYRKCADVVAGRAGVEAPEVLKELRRAV